LSNYFKVNLKNKHLEIIRTEKRFFDISDCQVQTNGGIGGNDGLVSDAVEVSAQEVADLVTESEERARRLESVESLLEQWINNRRALSRKATKYRLQLQKHEVVK
jgi:hypothetical protein